MKVKEMIEILEDMDPESKVYVFGSLGDFKVVSVLEDEDEVFIYSEDTFDYVDIED